MGWHREDLGKLLLRITIGGLVLLHGVHKLLHGVDGIQAMLTARGLPAPLAYGVFVGEFVAPLFVIAGVLTRTAALLIAVNMVVAIALAHGAELFALTRTGGWALELQAAYLLGAVAVALLGPGRYGFTKAARRPRR